MPFKWFRGMFLCTYCSLPIANIGDLRAHTLTHSNRLSVLGQRRSMDDFVKIDITDLRCELCLETIPSLNFLRTHLKTKHSKSFHADFGECLIPYLLKKSQFACTICGHEASTFMNLMKHMNVHYQRHICDNCGQGFCGKRQLQSHLMKHETGEFPCTKCGNVFKTKGQRNRHIAQMHGSGYTNRCPYCDDTFTSYETRAKHLTETHDIKSEFPCPICPAVFTLFKYRSRHVKKVHIKEKNHLCSECPSSFVSASELKYHMVRHVDEKNYECTVCRKAYARRKTLVEHMRIHNNDRRFVCSFCSHAFVQNCSLKQHMKVHHPGSK